jgi:hypothetical protein
MAGEMLADSHVRTLATYFGVEGVRSGVHLREGFYLAHSPCLRRRRPGLRRRGRRLEHAADVLDAFVRPRTVPLVDALDAQVYRHGTPVKTRDEFVVAGAFPRLSAGRSVPGSGRPTTVSFYDAARFAHLETIVTDSAFFDGIGR